MGLGRQQFGHGPIVAHQVDQKSVLQPFIDAFMLQQPIHIVQIPRMLAVQSRADLEGIKVFKTKQRYAGKPKDFYCLRR